jgi:DNA-binding NtrC family response regulator
MHFLLLIINVVKLSLPPLADRKEDIPLLVDHY